MHVGVGWGEMWWGKVREVGQAIVLFTVWSLLHLVHTHPPSSPPPTQPSPVPTVPLALEVSHLPWPVPLVLGGTCGACFLELTHAPPPPIATLLYRSALACQATLWALDGGATSSPSLPLAP